MSRVHAAPSRALEQVQIHDQIWSVHERVEQAVFNYEGVRGKYAANFPVLDFNTLKHTATEIDLVLTQSLNVVVE